MDESMKKKWLDALRSNKYQQGRYFLQRKGKFCCLGVLCEIAEVPAVLTQDATYTEEIAEGKLYAYDGNTSCPNPILLEKLGLGSTDYSRMEIVDQLTKMNDNGQSFEEIADYIEKNL